MGKMSRAQILKAAEELLDWLDADMYPACREVCRQILQENGEPERARIYADLLQGSDSGQELPARVGAFIVSLYETGIALNEDAISMLNLGAFYYLGRGCEQDFEKAVYYYELAAAGGEIIALENLGYCYYYGRSTEVDYKKAYYYFSQAALFGRPISIYKIADMYRYGCYLPRDEKRAFALYCRSLTCMEQSGDNSPAGPILLRLGDCFMHGIGTEKDVRSALVLYQSAEQHLYDKVAAGDYFYRGSLKQAIEGQYAARSLLREALG